MNVLGIETATSVCAVAVCRNSTIPAFQEQDVPNTHSERLLPMVDGVLKQSEIIVSELDAVAVSIGPGSFTGLRIGLSVAKGLVFSTKSKLVCVSTLEALAYMAAEDGLASTARILSVLDARRDRVYCQLFERDGAGVKPSCEMRLMPVAELAGEVGDAPLTLIGTGTQAIVNAAVVLEVGKKWHSVPKESNRSSARPVALLGATQLSKGYIEDVASAEPTYIMDFFENR